MCPAATYEVNIVQPKGIQAVFEELLDPATMVGPMR